jgi:pantoate--beta-alanine ligase
MRTVATIAEVRAALRPHRGTRSIGLVPTMGAFHDGHLALIRAARQENDVVAVSLFVNPTQFGPGEDLDRYPRSAERDSALAAESGVDLLFAPAAQEIYPAGFQTWVDVELVSEGLEGAVRPGHFRGVATVCLKLFNIVQPDRAYFGEKDAQQLALVQQLVRDLNMPIEIRAVPTVRDADGLALSSRNAYLSADERVAALALPRALEAGRVAYVHGDSPETAARAVLEAARAAGVQTDYCELARFDGRLVLAAAVRVGGTRLIDNVVLEGGSP